MIKFLLRIFILVPIKLALFLPIVAIFILGYLAGYKKEAEDFLETFIDYKI